MRTILNGALRARRPSYANEALARRKQEGKTESRNLRPGVDDRDGHRSLPKVLSLETCTSSDAKSILYKKLT